MRGILFICLSLLLFGCAAKNVDFELVEAGWYKAQYGDLNPFFLVHSSVLLEDERPYVVMRVKFSNADGKPPFTVSNRIFRVYSHTWRVSAVEFEGFSSGFDGGWYYLIHSSRYVFNKAIGLRPDAIKKYEDLYFHDVSFDYMKMDFERNYHPMSQRSKSWRTDSLHFTKGEILELFAQMEESAEVQFVTNNWGTIEHFRLLP